MAGVAVAFMEFSPWLKSKFDYQSSIAGTFADSNWFPSAVFGVLIVILAIIGIAVRITETIEG